MNIIENGKLNDLIILLDYHIDKVSHYAKGKKSFSLLDFYNYLPASFKKDKSFLRLDQLMKIANEIERTELLSQNDLRALQNNFWSPCLKLLQQINLEK